jgi:hypothetical protein
MLNEMATEVFELAKAHQTPRVAAEATSVAFTDSRAATSVDVHRQGWISTGRSHMTGGL